MGSAASAASRPPAPPRRPALPLGPPPLLAATERARLPAPARPLRSLSPSSHNTRTRRPELCRRERYVAPRGPHRGLLPPRRCVGGVGRTTRFTPPFSLPRSPLPPPSFGEVTAARPQRPRGGGAGGGTVTGRALGLTAGRGGARRGPVGAGCFWREGGMRGEGAARPCSPTRRKGGKRPRSLSPRAAAAALPPKPPPVGGRGASPKGPS